MVALVAMMMVIVLAMAAFAVDVGWVVTSKTQLQSAADAGALAGAGALVENYTLAGIRAEASHFAQINAPVATPIITFGNWDPDTQSFTPDTENPNAVRVLVERTAARGNAAPSFFGRLLGRDYFDIKAESIAVGAVLVEEQSSVTTSVYVTSTKDLSNVVLEFEDGAHQKFEPLKGYSGTFAGTGEHSGKTIVGVWIKSGSFLSGDGPGYGERILNNGSEITIHGENQNKGSVAKVTATFNATGVTFTESGSDGPVRIVK